MYIIEIYATKVPSNFQNVFLSWGFTLLTQSFTCIALKSLNADSLSLSLSLCVCHRNRKRENGIAQADKGNGV